METISELYASMEYGPAPESTGLAEAWLDHHGRTFDHFIGGTWQSPQPSARFESHNPATGDVLATVAQGSAADVDAAVDAAKRAFPAWKALSGHERARHLYALARAVQKHSRLFAVLESLDNGKPIRESRDIDVPLVARHFYHHAGWAQLMDEEFAGYEPHGVVGQIIPWNFPLLMLAWKVAPALAAGNTVVMKSAEFTPLTSLLFAEVTRDAGLPPGVFNLVTGDGETGKHLVAHPEVRKIAFTGSTEVGRLIREGTAGSGKELTLELGGKSPFVVFEDADLDAVVEGVVDAIWFNQGQVCCAGSRLLVQEGIADRLVRRLRERMERLRVGTPTDKGIDMGAIVAPVQVERIRGLVDVGTAEGARCWQPSWAGDLGGDGSFYPPTLFTEVAPSARIAQEEIFGPVLVTMTFRTPDEAVKLANNTTYGLAASVWSDDINLALDVAPRIKAGVVWINSSNLFDAAAGFGGYRESGFGREGGREGMWAYLKPSWSASAKRKPLTVAEDGAAAAPGGVLPGSGDGVNRTAKLYIGGRQKRPDGGYSYPVLDARGALMGEAGDGNRKDIRDAVEAASKASAWAATAGHSRAQILYYIAENLSARAAEFEDRVARSTGMSSRKARREVEASVACLFRYGAWADKFDGAVHEVPIRGVALAMHESVGVLGIVAPEESPLLSFISLMAPAMAMGNRSVMLPARSHALLATDFYTVLDSSDVPAGVVNIVTGDQGALAAVLADHLGVDGIWCFSSAAVARDVERRSAGNMKQVWSEVRSRDWYDSVQSGGREFLRHATQVKNIWIPYGA